MCIRLRVVDVFSLGVVFEVVGWCSRPGDELEDDRREREPATTEAEEDTEAVSDQVPRAYATESGVGHGSSSGSSGRNVSGSPGGMGS